MTPTTEAGRALLGAIQSGVAMLFAHDDGPDDPSPIPATIAAIEAEAVAAERARLRAALEGLHDHEVELAERTDVGRDVRFDAAGRATAYGRVLALLDAP